MESSREYFQDGFIVKDLPTLREHLQEVNILLGSLLGIDPSDENFFAEVHQHLTLKFQSQDKYFGFLKAFANSPKVQSIPSNLELQSALESCGIQKPSLVTPPLLHVVAEDLIVDSEKVFTPPHQDVVSTKGAIGQAVVWIPLHDVSTDSYGITVIPGSHKLGVLETDFSRFGHTVKQVQIRGLPQQYVEAKFGEAVIFSQYLVHHTHTKGKFRMAISFRLNDMNDMNWMERNYFVPFKRVGDDSVFEDNRHIPPQNSSQYFDDNGEKH